MVSAVIKNWCDYIDFDVFREKIHNRKLYIWGAYKQSDYIKNECSRNGIVISGFIESKKNIVEYAGLPVIKPEDITTPEEMYIVIPVSTDINNITTLLADKKFKVNNDYNIIRNHYEIRYTGGYYEDIYGNKIVCNNYTIGASCTIVFEGYNNIVEIGSDIEFEDTRLMVFLGSKMVINDKCRFSSSIVKCSNGAFISIGRDCIFGECEFYSYSIIRIGNECTFKRSTLIKADYDSPVTIGNDCMFSWPIYIRSNNGHALVDLDNKENTSVSKKHFVKIGNHVWLGQNVTVLFNADIGDNSVVGAGSLVNKAFPNNCVLAGNPARIIKENHSWGRKFKMPYEEFEKMN